MKSATVVGAGVFGASTARELAKRGWDVTLVEQYVPGTVRSGSGGDTRLLRAAHGSVEWYTDLAWRSRRLWLELEEEHATRLWEPVGVAWFAYRDDGFEAESRATLEAAGVPCEWLNPDEARRLYPSLGVDDLNAVLYEPRLGSAACAARDPAPRRRRRTQRGAARTGPADTRRRRLERRRGLGLRRVAAEVVPRARRAADRPPRRLLLRYRCPVAGNARLLRLRRAVLRARRDRRARREDRTGYGKRRDRPRPPRPPAARPPCCRRPRLHGEAIPGARRRTDRRLSRLPVRAHADTHFLFAPHPERADWWLLGGGSGHGFKHGPALAEYVADCVEGLRQPEPFHALGPRTGNAGLRTAVRG